MSHQIDNARSACLCDVGQGEYLLAFAVAEDGSDHPVLARRDAIDDPGVTYDFRCPGVAHEQLGALPLEFVRRITISRRTHRCGRLTKAGTPCRAPVHRPGDTCTWHRAHKTAKGTGND